MIRLLVTFIFAGLLTVSAERASADGKRVALVVGISSYTSAPKLPNAGNDANAMADLFRKAGFDVVTARSDVSNLEFKRTIREFEDSVVGADIAVVFYAGHGIQVRETNYLIPGDAKLLNERDIEDEAIPLDRLISAVDGAKRLRLIILDACRDNPFANKMQRRVASRAAPAPGLGRIEPTMSDTLIAYAAKDGSVANDGDGSHSPYTTALLKNLTKPGMDIRIAFGHVRDDVIRATNGKQEPFVYGSLGGGTVSLVPAPIEAAPALHSGRGGEDAARRDYELVERVGKVEAWEVFLNAHKNGLYADLARVQLDKLRDAEKLRVAGRSNLGEADRNVGPRVNAAPATDASTPAPALPPVDATPKPTAQEQRAWDRLKASTNQAAITKFLEQFPSSPLATAAQERLELLAQQAREREEAMKVEREAAAQREAEARAKAAEIAAKQREEEERVKAVKAAAKQREAEERARAAEVERQKAEELAAVRQREAEERAKAAEQLARQREEAERIKAAAKQLEVEERQRAAEALARQREAEAQLKAAEAERRKAEAQAAAKQRAEERAAAAEAAAKQRQAEETVKAAEAERRKAEAQASAKQREAEESAKTVEKLQKDREAEDRAQLVAKKREAEERAKAERAAALKRQADERVKSAEAEKQKAEAQVAANRRKAIEAEAQKAQRQAAAAALAERRQKAAETKAAPVARAPVAAQRPVAVAAPRAGNAPATMVGIGF